MYTLKGGLRTLYVVVGGREGGGGTRLWLQHPRVLVGKPRTT